MAIYDFTFEPRNNANLSPERAPSIPSPLPMQPNLVENDNLLNSDINLNQPEDVRSVLVRGFYAMDRGILNYFKDIQVPTKDNVRKLEVRIAGGDKTFLIWKQDVRSGRIKLPVMSINRTGWKFNEQKFSPPHIPMSKRFANPEGSRIVLTYRPWPALIDYTLSVWTERKRDMEFIMHDIITRFHPLAEFRIDDESGLRGSVQLRFGDAIDNSDVDIGAEEQAKVRYDINVTMEGWLPLPEKILPTVLGKVTTLHEISGKFLEALDNKHSNVIEYIFKR
ncbi:MAG: hypothetical protein QXU32_00610 [Nitrososphaerales archaeon]